MITVKISDLLNSTEALQKLANKELKAKLAWTISRLLKAAEAEIQNFNDTRMNLIRKYGEKDENGELENGRPYEIAKTDEIHEAKVYERLDDALIVIYALTKAFKTNTSVTGFRVYRFEETLNRVEQIP